MSYLKVESNHKIWRKHIDTLLNCSARDVESWIVQNESIHSREFLQFLKDEYIIANEILKEPQRAELLTQAALLIATQIPKDVGATALAQWMRGLWAMYHRQRDAVILFQAALIYYETVNERLSVARLQSNLVGVFADLAENMKAEEYYHLARHTLIELDDQDPKFLVYLEQNFGWLLHCWGRYTEALEAHDRAFTLATKSGLTADIPDILNNRHLTLGYLGRFSEIEEGFQHDRKLAETAQQWVTVARINMNLGELYTILGQPANALRHFQLATSGFGEMEQGYLSLAQATLYRQLGASSAALAYYESALPLLEKDQLKSFYAEAQLNLAICLRIFGHKKYKRKEVRQRIAELLLASHTHWLELGHEYWLTQLYFEEVLFANMQKQWDRAIHLLEQPSLMIKNPRLLAEFQFLRAETFRLAHLAEEGSYAVEQDYKAVLTYSVSEGLYWLGRNALIGLGKYYLNKNAVEARRLLEEAAEIDDRLRQTLSLQELKASFHEQANDLYTDLIQQAFEQGEHERLLQYTWRAKASAFIELGVSIRDESSYTLEQHQAIDHLRQQIAALRWSLAKAAEKNVLDARYEEMNPELAQLLDRLLALRRQGRQHQTQIATLSNEQIKSALAQMDADLLLEYVRCDNRIYGICATREGVCNVVQLADTNLISIISGHLNLSFNTLNSSTEAQRLHQIEAQRHECQQLLQQCYDILVAPLLAEVDDHLSINQILVAPCDALAMLPFAAFWNGRNYWVEVQQIEMIQSGALLLVDSPTTDQYSSSLIIAASTGNVAAVCEEAKQIATLLVDSTIFVDTPALTYLDSLSKPPRILHIAAHTIQRGDAPLFTAIQLTCEVLSVEHSFELPLWGTELVTLSGCSTASGMTSDASLFAFQSALLIAGAKRVLCTLWSVGDDIPKAMMTYFYTLVTNGIPIPTALRQTQLHFMHQDAYDHPALWATFTCVRR